MRLMKTLDDAWNAGPYSPRWETFRKRHKEDVKVYWPNQPEPTKGRYDHYLQAVEFFKNFNTVFLTTPYKIAFGYGDHACTVADWMASLKRPMKGVDGNVVQPGKTAHLEFARSPHGGTARSFRSVCSTTSKVW